MINLLKIGDQISYTYQCPILNRQVRKTGTVNSCDCSISGNITVIWSNGIKHRLSDNRTVQIKTINGQTI